MKDFSLFSSVGFSSGLARGWEGSQPGPRLEQTVALVVPPVGAHPFLCLCRVRLKLYLRIVLLSRHNPAAMRSCCGGKRGFRHTPRNHSNRLLAADEGCASAPVRHMVYDGNRKYDRDGPVKAWKDKLTAGKVQRQRGTGLITLTV